MKSTRNEIDNKVRNNKYIRFLSLFHKLLQIEEKNESLNSLALG